MRINVVGVSGSGKSTFSKRLAKKLHIPYVELDALNWQANWTPSTDAQLFSKLEAAISGDGWILDGSYSKTTHIKWQRVQMVIYLDLPFYIVLARIIKRSFLRGYTKQELWAGNTETVWQHLFTSDSMILWTFKTFRLRRKQHTQKVAEYQNSSIKFIRLSSTKQVEAFLQNFEQ